MKAINAYIDQTILNPEADRRAIEGFIREAAEFNFYAAVVNPCWIQLLHKELPAKIKRCSVVGFPLGASSSKSKACAAGYLIEKGCDEIDMVMNIGYFKSGAYEYVLSDIQSVVKAAQGRIVKVIIETCLLNDEEKITAAKLIVESGAQYVKTSTGFSKHGANTHDVGLLRDAVGPQFGIKASGGIRDYDTALQMINAGADRIGTSAGVRIINENPDRERYMILHNKP